MFTDKRGICTNKVDNLNSFLQELCPSLDFDFLVKFKVTRGHTFKINGSYSRALAPTCGALVTCLQNTPFENTVRKGEIALNEQFLLFLQCFCPLRKFSSIFINFRIVIHKLFHFERVYNLWFGKELKVLIFFVRG